MQNRGLKLHWRAHEPSANNLRHCDEGRGGDKTERVCLRCRDLRISLRAAILRLFEHQMGYVNRHRVTGEGRG